MFFRKPSVVQTNLFLKTWMSPRMLHADSILSNCLSGSQPITDIPSAVPTNKHWPFSLKIDENDIELTTIFHRKWTFSLPSDITTSPTRQYLISSHLNVIHFTVLDVNVFFVSERDTSFLLSRSYKSTEPSFRPAASRNSNGWNWMHVTGDACSWNSMIRCCVRMSHMITEPVDDVCITESKLVEEQNVRCTFCPRRCYPWAVWRKFDRIYVGNVTAVFENALIVLAHIP